VLCVWQSDFGTTGHWRFNIFYVAVKIDKLVKSVVLIAAGVPLGISGGLLMNVYFPIENVTKDFSQKISQ